MGTIPAAPPKKKKGLPDFAVLPPLRIIIYY